MTPAEAAALNPQFSSSLVMWFITLSEPAYPGRAVAYAMLATNSGGHRLPGELVAETIEEVRAMLPAGLRRSDWVAFDPMGPEEAWELGWGRIALGSTPPM